MNVMERHVEKFSNMGAMFFLGFLAAVAYYKVPKLWEKEALLGPVQAYAQCEHRRADRTTDVAVQALIAQGDAAGVEPDFSAIPPDNCSTLLPHAKMAPKK